jgi:radical SAM protein with 4Fe4S-binding SPASM domain
MLKLGYGPSELWKTNSDFLSAPTEIHFSVTNKCPMKCRHCYVEADKELPNELSISYLKKIIDIIADMGLFHVAFGGGEPFARDDFLELVKYTRGRDIVPNVTTNGFYIDEKIAKQCNIFGQINVSIDGIGRNYKILRGFDGFKIANKAVKLLRKYNKNVGINCVVSKNNFDQLEEIVKYARTNKLKSVLFLRYKPSGRARNNYYKNKLTNEQNKKIYPLLMKFLRKYKIRLHLDCSFVPMICYHKPPLKIMDFFSIDGCEAGNVLAGILPDGRFNACSFCSDDGGNIFDLKEQWKSSDYLNKYREWFKQAKEPCKSCKYLKICKGGCHIVSKFVNHNFYSPDPECPIVVDYNK